MLYLAQVNQDLSSRQYELHLLARQESENRWVIIPEPTLIPLQTTDSVSDKLLVLVQLSDGGNIESWEDACQWVIYLVQTYLTTGMTPAQLQQETERAESWRQTLTLQNQELAQRSLELEARREQIQALEQHLKRNE